MPPSETVRALVGPDAGANLSRLPCLRVLNETLWTGGTAVVGGTVYPAAKRMTASFAVPASKPEAYASALRASIDASGRPVRASLEAD